MGIMRRLLTRVASLRAPLLFSALLAAGLAPLGAQTAELEGLDAYIRQAMTDWEIPGFAIAVVQGDQVIFARGYGEREIGTGEPVDEHTLFAVASTTKAMTAAALGMLVDEGTLQWDDPVINHMPGFQLADPWVTRHVTIRDLLTHRTGVAGHDNVWIAAPFDRAEIVRRARHLPQVSGFRAGYGYNNIMYMVAGEVVAAATGIPWDDFLEARILRPLGMDRTTSRTAALEALGNVATAHIRHQGRVIPMPRRDYDALGPAGSVWSSAHDMARWIRLHLAGGAHQGRQLLQPVTLEEMRTPQVVIRMDTTARRRFPTQNYFAYGLGWRLHDYHGHNVVQHTGAVNFTRTQVGLIPDQGIAVVAFANLSTSALQTAIMYRVFDALLGIAETDWSAEYLASGRRSAGDGREPPRTPGTRPSLPLDAYTGTFSDSLFGDIRLDLDSGALVLRYSPDYVADLEHWHHDTFRAVWRTPGFGYAFLTFALDARGAPRTLELEGFTAFHR
jgi:CubicO group peptidase (beta-lactamase class C family)